MKKILITLLLTLSCSVFANVNVDKIVGECERQMALDICTAKIDRNSYPKNATVLLAGIGRINLDAYIKIKDAGDNMCTLARAYCTNTPNSDECKASQALWQSK
jgi:hypothetical protein